MTKALREDWERERTAQWLRVKARQDEWWERLMRLRPIEREGACQAVATHE